MLNDSGELWLIDGGRSAYEADDPVNGAPADEGDITWYGETGDIGMDSPGNKWIRKITIRLAMEPGARLTVEIQYNSDGNWQRAMTVETERKKTLVLPIRTQRCDHFRLRYTGTGDVRIYSISKTVDQGSERTTLAVRR